MWGNIQTLSVSVSMPGQARLPPSVVQGVPLIPVCIKDAEFLVPRMETLMPEEVWRSSLLCSVHYYRYVKKRQSPDWVIRCHHVNLEQEAPHRNKPKILRAGEDKGLWQRQKCGE